MFILVYKRKVDETLQVNPKYEYFYPLNLKIIIRRKTPPPEEFFFYLENHITSHI